MRERTGDSSLYAHHVYRAMFSGKTADVNFTDYAKALSTLCRGSTYDKLLWTFRVRPNDPLSLNCRVTSSLCQLYDVDGNGRITLDEVQEIARSIYALLGYYVAPRYDLSTSDDRARQLFARLDPQNKSFVTKDDFLRICVRVCLLGSRYAPLHQLLFQHPSFRSAHADEQSANHSFIFFDVYQMRASSMCEKEKQFHSFARRTDSSPFLRSTLHPGHKFIGHVKREVVPIVQKV